MAFLVDAQDPAAGIPAPAPHPLAPLTAAEIEAAASAVKAAKGLGDTARFVYVSLYEPSKHEVIAFEAGGPGPGPAREGRHQGAGRARHLRGHRQAPRRRGRRLQAGPRRPAKRHVRRVHGRRGHRPQGPALAGGDAQARHHQLRPVHDRPVVHAERRAGRRPRRRPLRLAAHLGARRPGRQRLRPPGRRRRHQGRPGHADRRQRRRLRRPAAAAEEGQLLHGQDLRPGERPVLPRRPAHGRQAARHHPARGPELRKSTATT